MPEALHRELHAAGVPHAVRDGIAPADYAALAEAETRAGFDDIIVLDPDVARLEAASRVVATAGVVAMIGEQPLARPVAVDVGRIHYDYVVYLGKPGPDIGSAYGAACNRAELKPGGVAWIVGGGGPMGRMHLQRMLEMPAGPARIVVAETNLVRNADLAQHVCAAGAGQGHRADRDQPQTDGGGGAGRGAGRGARRPRLR